MKYNGFIWIESLFTMNIVILIAVVFIPIYVSLQKERLILENRLHVSLYVANSFSGKTYKNHSVTINNDNVYISYELKDDVVEGCAKWTNKKKRKEKVCLYALAYE